MDLPRNPGLFQLQTNRAGGVKVPMRTRGQRIRFDALSTECGLKMDRNHQIECTGRVWNITEVNVEDRLRMYVDLGGQRPKTRSFIHY